MAELVPWIRVVCKATREIIGKTAWYFSIRSTCHVTCHVLTDVKQSISPSRNYFPLHHPIRSPQSISRFLARVKIYISSERNSSEWALSSTWFFRGYQSACLDHTENEIIQWLSRTNTYFIAPPTDLLCCEATKPLHTLSHWPVFSFSAAELLLDQELHIVLRVYPAYLADSHL